MAVPPGRVLVTVETFVQEATDSTRARLSSRLANASQDYLRAGRHTREAGVASAVENARTSR